MRIAMVAACPFPWPRGTPIRIHRMAEALVARGHDVHVVTYHLGDRTQLLAATVHRIVDVPGYSDCRPGPTLRKLAQLDPRLTRLLGQLLDRMQFDVLHAHHYEGLLTAYFAARRRPRPPIVFDAHTSLAAELPSYPLGWPAGVMRAMGAALDRRLPRLAQHVIAVSTELAESFLAQGAVAASALTVVPNGVETPHFANAVAHHLLGEAPRIAFAGNLAPYQGIDLLLEAFARLRAARPDARLLLLTEGDFTPWAALARRLGVAGAIDRPAADYVTLPGYLQAADVLLNPRTACTGLPQKLLNYMAAGRPIVSFAGSAHVIEHDRTALLVADGDVDGFAAAILRLLREPALGARLGAAAQRLARERYDWDRVAAQVEEVYARVGLRDPHDPLTGAADAEEPSPS